MADNTAPRGPLDTTAVVDGIPATFPLRLRAMLFWANGAVAVLRGLDRLKRRLQAMAQK